MLVTNLLFTRVFVLIYSCFTRNYVMIFQALIYDFDGLKQKEFLCRRVITK